MSDPPNNAIASAAPLSHCHQSFELELIAMEMAFGCVWASSLKLPLILSVVLSPSLLLHFGSVSSAQC